MKIKNKATQTKQNPSWKNAVTSGEKSKLNCDIPSDSAYALSEKMRFNPTLPISTPSRPHAIPTHMPSIIPFLKLFPFTSIIFSFLKETF